MRNVLLLFLCCGLTSCLAQHLHTPSELFALMEKSSIQYEEDSLFHISATVASAKIQEGWQRNGTTGELQAPSSDFETSVDSGKYQNKADKYFSKSQFSKAAANYSNAIEENKGKINADLQKKLCRTFLQIEKTLDAGEALIPLMETHQPDFGLHLLLAQIYQQSQQKDLAIKHITLAHLLNRNELKLLERLEQIYEENGLHFHKWNFDPQYQVRPNKKGGVLVAYRDSPWRAYGVCRAVWENEPEYAERMGRISTEPQKMIEQKECLLNALIAFEKPGIDQNQFPEFQCLAKALPNNDLNSFILYEIDARQNPMLLCQMETAELMNILDFVKKYHSSPSH